jgi:hypothetical protein
MIPSMEQRKSQLNLLHAMEQERRNSKEFLFPDENALHRRRPSAHVTDSATQSEDDENSTFEVRNLIKSYEFTLSVYYMNVCKIEITQISHFKRFKQTIFIMSISSLRF